MGRKPTKFDPSAEKNRARLAKFYSKHKLTYKIKHLTDAYHINPVDLESIETDEEKYLYCLEISNKIKLERIRGEISSN